MALENLKGKKLTENELDEVAGGAEGDRIIASLWVKHYYDADGGTHGNIIDTSGKNPNEIMAAFCAKAGIDYQMNSEGLDQYKINGEWRDAVWLASNKKEALAFFDSKLGIN